MNMAVSDDNGADCPDWRAGPEDCRVGPERAAVDTMHEDGNCRADTVGTVTDATHGDESLRYGNCCGKPDAIEHDADVLCLAGPAEAAACAASGDVNLECVSCCAKREEAESNAA